MTNMRMTNMQLARAEAGRCNAAGIDRPFGARATGWFGNDSDFPVRFWRVGGNAAIVEATFGGLEAVRWHDLIRRTMNMRYPAQWAF